VFLRFLADCRVPEVVGMAMILAMISLFLLSNGAASASLDACDADGQSQAGDACSVSSNGHDVSQQGGALLQRDTIQGTDDLSIGGKGQGLIQGKNDPSTVKLGETAARLTWDQDDYDYTPDDDDDTESPGAPAGAPAGDEVAPAGPPGPKGVQGPAGSAGEVGPAGFAGPPGPRTPGSTPAPTALTSAPTAAPGTPGTQAPSAGPSVVVPGPPGPKGATGVTGAPGDAGERGFPGPPGPQGQGGPAQTPAPTDGSSDSKVAAREWEHFNLLNDLRAAGFTCPYGNSYAANAVPLQFDCRLWRASQLHSVDMATNDYFAHNSLDGTTPWQRAEAQGITANGENIAAGSSTASAVLEQWKSSDGHCNNMMKPQMVIGAVGWAAGGSYRHYWTQMFKSSLVPLDTSCLPAVSISSASPPSDYDVGGDKPKSLPDAASSP